MLLPSRSLALNPLPLHRRSPAMAPSLRISAGASVDSLSVLHVMLELPLNHQSFAGIGRELASLFRPVPAATPKGARKRPGKART